MKDVALCLAIIGIFLLLGLALFSPVREISSLEQVSVNERVTTSGIIYDERVVGDINIMKINGMDAVCDCSGNYVGKNVTIFGKIENYNDKKQIKIFRLVIN